MEHQLSFNFDDVAKIVFDLADFAFLFDRRNLFNIDFPDTWQWLSRSDQKNMSVDGMNQNTRLG